MRNFAFSKARSIAEAAASADLVAQAMLAPDGGLGAQDLRIVKAGGIDQMDLMKEAWLATEPLTSLAHIPGLDAITAAPEAALPRADGPARPPRRGDPAIGGPYPALAEAAGDPIRDPRGRDDRRQSHAASALLVFRLASSVPAQGSGLATPLRARTHYHGRTSTSGSARRSSVDLGARRLWRSGRRSN